MIYKTPHRTPKIEQHNQTRTRG